MVLIEGIGLNSARGIAGRRIGRCTTGGTLGGKMQTTNNPQHSRNIDYPKYQPEKNGETQTELNCGCAPITGDEIKSLFQSIATFPLQCPSESGSMRGLAHERSDYTSSSPALRRNPQG